MKTILLGDFTKRDTNILTEIINDYLLDMGVKPVAVAFHIEVDVYEEEDA